MVKLILGEREVDVTAAAIDPEGEFLHGGRRVDPKEATFERPCWQARSVTMPSSNLKEAGEARDQRREPKLADPR